MAETERPDAGSELKLLSVDKENLVDDPFDRSFGFTRKELVEAVGQLKIANESINELNSRLERLTPSWIICPKP